MKEIISPIGWEKLITGCIALKKPLRQNIVASFMNIKQSYVDKFKELYEKTFNEKIAREEAFEQCLKLVLLVNKLYQPITVIDFERIQARRRQTGDL